MDRIIKKKLWTAKRISLLSFAGFVIIIMAYNIFSSREGRRLNVDGERITISTVERGPFREYIPVRGEFLPIETMYLDAVEGGRVSRIFIEAGTTVNKGDAILQLENTNLVLDIMYREAQLFEQSNNLRNTRLSMEQHFLTMKSQLAEIDYNLQRLRRELDRNSKLFEKQLIPRQDYENIQDEYEYTVKRKELAVETIKQDSLFRQTQIEQLERSLARMQANLEITKEKQENLTLRAPISGLLTSLNAEVGQSKSPGERLGQIDVMDNFKVRAQIDEHYITRVETGLTGDFEIGGKTYDLVVNKIYPEVIDGRFEIDMGYTGDTPESARRGQTVQIRLALGSLSDALLLARGGFYQETGGNWVFVIDESRGMAVKRSIRLGRQNPLNFEVVEGLTPGDKVITSGYENFGDADILVLKK